MNMSNWKARILKKKGKGSQTPGKLKNQWCQASPLDRWFASHNRSYKDSGYSDWFNRKNGDIR